MLLCGESYYEFKIYREKNMKTLNAYMAMAYRMEIVVNKDEGVLAFPIRIFWGITYGETIESAVVNVGDVRRGGLKQLLKMELKFMNQMIRKVLI